MKIHILLNQGLSRWALIAVLLIFLKPQIFAQVVDYPLTPTDDVDFKGLKEDFHDVPGEYKLRVWWFWMNGVATKESITRDLEAMKAKCIGGALIVDNGADFGPVGPTFMSKQWKGLFAHAVQEADRLGIELSVNIQSGCGDPGNPNIQPYNSIKKIVSSETKVTGPGKTEKKLPVPSSQLYYKDIQVQAVKTGTGQADTDKPTIDMDDIIILNAHFSNGLLTWDVPPGDWTVIRYGMTSTGKRNNYASPGYRGGLCYDQMNPRGIKAHWEEVAQPLVDTAKSSGNSLKFVHTDSWEMGMTNWTHGFLEEFEKRRGYDIDPYLPVLAGKIVHSQEISERFREDFRLTIGDLITEENYAVFRDLAHSNGLLLHSESAGPHMPPIDALRNLGINDIPVGEFWTRSATHRVSERQRLHVKQTSSAAHIYGQRFCAAEGPTSVGPQWQRSPKDLKSLFDIVFCDGVNRVFWHTYTSSPDEYGLPGIEYFAGTHFNRHVTWWNQAEAFINYINRSQLMLSQGLPAVDVLYYYGSGVPHYIHLDKDVNVPAGYEWDGCNSEVLLSRATVKKERIHLPDGMNYPLLALAGQKSISLPVLKKIEEMVQKGIILVGKPPQRAHGLSGYPESDKEVKAIVERLWGEIDQKTVFKNIYGKGKVYSGLTIAQVLKREGIGPDFSYAAAPNVDMDYFHRSARDIEIYYVTNKRARHGINDRKYRYLTDLPDRYIQATCSFRVDGERKVERWNPVTGEMTPVQVYKQKNARYTIPVSLPPEGSTFFVFRRSTAQPHITKIEKEGDALTEGNAPLVSGAPEVFVQKSQLEIAGEGIYRFTWNNGAETTVESLEIPEEVSIDGSWEIHFMEKPVLGEPMTTRIDSLKCWTDFEQRSIRYFSGTARYKKEFTLNGYQTKNGKVYLDLGNVQELATIRINGNKVKTCWKAPFRADITEYIKEGNNLLEIDVTNLWSNRLIGDEMLPREERKTQTNIRKSNRYRFDSPDAEKYLRVSGLLGPVKLKFTKIYKLTP